MSFKSTPGVHMAVIRHPPRDGVKAFDEAIFAFDLSEMTMATALADPTLSDITTSEWTVDQLFTVMFAVADPPSYADKDEVEKERARLRPMFLSRFVSALEGIPKHNDKPLKYAAVREKGFFGSSITAFRSTYSTPEAPEKVENTILVVSARATLLQRRGRLSRVRDDLYRPRDPNRGFREYLREFRRLRLDPLQALVAKNDADVRKVLSAMAAVQQISVALSFAEDFSLNDRSKVWSDFFEKAGNLREDYRSWRHSKLEELFWHGNKHSNSVLNHVQIERIRVFKKQQIDPLVDQLGKAAAWAYGGQAKGVTPCESAKKRDEKAKLLLKFLRMDDVILGALEKWDELSQLEMLALEALFGDIMSAFSRCPGVMDDLLRSEFLAAAHGAAGLAGSIPALPRENTRQKQLSDAIAGFESNTALRYTPTDLTKVITKAFSNYKKTKQIAAPIVSLWAHSTPAILARFDKLTPDRVNVDGTAYLFRSVFGMGLMSPKEMKALYSDLDGVLESAVTRGAGDAETKRRLTNLFELDLSHGKYPVRSNWWSDGRIFNAFKLAVGVLGIRQGFISAVDQGTLSPESFIDLSASVLTAADGARALHEIFSGVSGAGKSAFQHAPTFLAELSPAAKLARISALVSLVSKYQALAKTDASSLDRDYANADLAVAWITLVLVVSETALGTTFPVAGLALILLRWALFDQDLWNLIGGVTSETPMVKIVRGMMDKIDGGKVGKLLKSAPNWQDIAQAVERVRIRVPATVPSDDAEKFEMYFHLRTEHEVAIRRYAVRSYGLVDEIAELLIED